MEHKCCEITCGADACPSCGACLTEHNEDPVTNHPKQTIHRTTVNCDRIKELKAQLEEEYSRGVKDGLNQAADIVKNC